MLVIQDVTKEYARGVRANDQITLSIEKGEIFGLLGPNGSGKTTLVSQIIGFLKPTAGEIYVDSVDVVRKPNVARNLCSIQPQNQISLNGLTPRQAIELSGKIRKVKNDTMKRRTSELLKALQLEEWADTQTDYLSGGVRRLVTFCMAVVVPGKLVILDEPTNDVDPIRRKLLWKQVRQVANDGAAILLVTHNVLEAEKSVDRLALINHGKLVGLGTPASLKGDFHNKLRLELSLHSGNEVIDYPSYTNVVSRTKHRVILSLLRDHVTEVVEWTTNLQASGIIEEFSLSAATLEDAYFHYIGGS